MSRHECERIIQFDVDLRHAVVEAREDERVHGVIRSEAMLSKLQEEKSVENTISDRWL